MLVSMNWKYEKFFDKIECEFILFCFIVDSHYISPINITMNVFSRNSNWTHVDPFAIKHAFAIPITQCNHQEQPQLTLSHVECRNGNVHRKGLQAPSETDTNMNII
jgi:hypothetical protein